MNTATSTFTGPVQGRDYRGNQTRDLAWTYDSGDPKPGDRGLTWGVRLEVRHDKYRKAYVVELQACGLGDGYYVIGYGSGPGSDPHRVLEVQDAPRYSKRVFETLAERYADSAESLCRDFYADISFV